MSNAVVTIAKGRARPFWFGCPVVFSGSVAGVSGNPAAGELVAVHDDRGQEIGLGFYNPASSYRVRLVARGGGEACAEEIIGRRIHDAWMLRRTLGLPGPADTVFRLVNSEGDHLSGITIDVFDRFAVVMESAMWAGAWRGLVAATIRECLGPDMRVCFRVPSSIRGLEGIMVGDEGEVPDEPVRVVENGISFVTRPGQGQKTGFYADQRENRLALRRFCRGASVLDLFSFSGGFALNAAAGGAVSVTAVDSSVDAIAAGEANAAANGFGGCVRFVRDDVERFLAGSAEHDIVICDPPKLAAGRASQAAALKHYQRLNQLALGAVRDGGLLVTCSCSSVVRRDDFLGMLRDAAGHCGRELSVIGLAGAGPDHPVCPAWPEGEYLKVVTAAVGKVGRP